MTKFKFVLCMFTLLILIITVHTGCGDSKMSQRTYDKIHNGLTLAEVDKIMGFDETKSNSNNLQTSNKVMRLVIYNVKDEPTSVFIVAYAIVEEGKEIKVKFDEDKVISKECKGL